ncbi:MAG: ABC transporter ATP-binding protein [Saprospiraceae bacterium]|nr:ABC transporter ATP-binding protein [Candidatus Vicinibacter affinis]
MIDFSLICNVKILEIRDLSVSFKQGNLWQNAINGINFSVFEGEALGIVGESGSGKSVTSLSIMKLLSSQAKYDSGKILWQEHESQTVDLLKLSEDQIRHYRGRKIAMIFQEPMSALNPLLKCGFQVKEALVAHNMGRRCELRSKGEYWFSKVGLEDVARVYDSYPHQLSGGQLQRVLIAIALCCEPKVIIADEPTTALDVTIQKKILDLLEDIRKEMNLTLIFISHDLGVIKNLCDRVLVMQNGQIIESNTAENIFLDAKHPYTQGLINCKPPLNCKIRHLPIVQDFLEGSKKEKWFNDTMIISNQEQQRKLEDFDQSRSLLEVANLQVSYIIERNIFGKVTKSFDAVRDVSFKIRPGESLGLVGESGSGKSSIGLAILNLIQIAGGQVSYDGFAINNYSVQDWKPLRRELQIIFQDPYSSLNPRKRIGDAIVEPMEVHKLYKNYKERKEAALELLLEVGLSEDHFDRYPHQFSGGQRQRICIARSLGLKPKFIVFDESVSALDVSVQAQVLNLLTSLKEKFKLSYLFITHDFSVVNFIADRIIVMKNGEIVEEGLPFQILNYPSTEYTRNLINAIPR